MISSTLIAQDSNSSTDPEPKAEIEAATGERPASAGRVVRAFDFEEQEYNPLPVPLGWIRAQDDPNVPRIRPGFPIWNGAVLDYQSPAFSGIGSIKLPTKGGSTSLILRRGEINIFPDADYLVSARVKTEGLLHSKARVVAKLLNQQGEPIDDAVSASPLAFTQGEWEQVALEIEGVYPTAAFIQIELQLLQPKQQYEERIAPKFTVWEQDFQGAAWFDNLIIAQLPRLELSTGTPGNIVESNSPPPLNVLVRDLTGDAIIARARIFDVHGHEVSSQILANGSRRVRSQWTPDLPGFGWYRAMLEVAVDNQLVGVRTLDFIWSSPNTSEIDSGIFGVHAKLTDPKITQSIQALVAGSGVNKASLEVWNQHTTFEDIQLNAPPMLAVQQLVNSGVQSSIALSQLPQELADSLSIDPSQILPIFSRPIEDWSKWGTQMLDQYGQAVSNWRFSDQATQEQPTQLNQTLDDIESSLFGYVPSPVIVTPWAIDRPIDPQLIRSNHQLLILDNPATDEDTMTLIVDDWIDATQKSATESGAAFSSLGMSLNASNATQHWTGIEVWSSVGSLARKAISFWWSTKTSGLDSNRFDLELQSPWRVSPGKRGQVMPAPELVVWRTLATHLGQRDAITEIEFIPGVRMLVLGPPADDTSASTSDNNGAIILWLDTPTIDPVTLNLPLSMDTVTQHDVFDNKQGIELDRIGSLNLPVHQILIGRSPTIITGVNTNLVEFLSSLNLTPDKLQAKSGIHKHALTISNPWPFSIRGRVFIVEPGGYTDPDGEIDRSWEITPRVIPFAITANDRQELPLELGYSLGEIAGTKKLVFDVELQADQDYPLVRVQREIELGIDGVEMLLSTKTRPDGLTKLTVQILNKLDSPQDFEVIAIPPAEARLRRSINAISPGEQVSRDFAFTKVKSGDQIIVTLILSDSSHRLNQIITVP